jgi:hypothetical protein
MLFEANTKILALLKKSPDSSVCQFVYVNIHSVYIGADERGKYCQVNDGKVFRSERVRKRAT